MFYVIFIYISYIDYFIYVNQNNYRDRVLKIRNYYNIIQPNDEGGTLISYYCY